MKLKDMPIEELELLSYTDITYRILKENGKSMTTPVLFKEICDLLEYGESEFDSKIGDYYTSLTMDKRFVMLKNNEWDIRDNHSVEIIIDDEEEDVIEEESDEELDDVEESEDEEDILDDDTLDDALDDDIDEDMEDLSIIDEDEMEE